MSTSPRMHRNFLPRICFLPISILLDQRGASSTRPLRVVKSGEEIREKSRLWPLQARFGMHGGKDGFSQTRRLQRRTLASLDDGEM
jgi:hypothetical protein